MNKITNDRVVFAMDAANPPALTIQPGEKVTFETLDCFSNQICSPEDRIGTIDLSHVNPATGPVFVEEAEPGDVLKVTIHTIDVADQAASIVSPGMSLFGDRITEEKSVIIPVKDGKAFFRGIPVDLAPMVGVIGTAPAGDPVPTGVPGRHGGNMDCTRIKAGATVYLPVNVEGALFALGDLHAAMGDGEVSVSGMEISGQVEVTIDVIKNTDLPTPSVSVDGVFAIIRSADTLDEAALACIEATTDYLAKALDLPWDEALMFASNTCDLTTCQALGPALSTMRMEIPETYLTK